MAGKLRSNFTWDFCMQGTQMFKWLNTYGKVVLHVNYFDSNKLSHLLVIMTNVLTSEYSVFFLSKHLTGQLCHNVQVMLHGNKLFGIHFQVFGVRLKAVHWMRRDTFYDLDRAEFHTQWGEQIINHYTPASFHSWIIFVSPFPNGSYLRLHNKP